MFYEKKLVFRCPECKDRVQLKEAYIALEDGVEYVEFIGECFHPFGRKWKYVDIRFQIPITDIQNMLKTGAKDGQKSE